jgi:O-antigen ligase
MSRPTELVAPAAAAAVVLTAVLGGGFFPLPRLVVGGALIAVWVVGAVGARGPLDRTEWLFAVLLAWGLLSAVWVGSSPLAAKETLTIWITAFALFGISRRGSAESRRRAMAVLTVGAAVIAAGIVAEALSAGLRVGGFLENPNVAAGLLVPTLPLGWWVLESRPRWRWIWVSLVAAGVLCTGSRAGLLASIVAVGLLLPRGRFRLAGLLTASALAAIVLVWRFVSQPDLLAWHRISIWWAVLKIWLTRPLTGVGPGGLVEAAGPERILHADQVGRYQFVVGYAESTPLAVLVQLGAVGLVLAFLVAVALVLKGRESGAMAVPTRAASLAAVAVLGLFHDFLTIDPVLWQWAVVAGCLVGMFPAAADRPPPDARRAARWAAALVMIWLTAWGMMTPALARFVWWNAEPSRENAGRVMRVEPWLARPASDRAARLMADPGLWSWTTAAEALAWARRAVEVHPGRAALWADLGRVHIRVLTDLGGTEHDVEAARAALDRACALDPRLPWHWLERARIARIAGDHLEAIRLTQKALSLEPNTVRGWLMLSRLELEAGRVEAAREAFDRARESRHLLGRPGINAYERELLDVSVGQMRQLEERLK